MGLRSWFKGGRNKRPKAPWVRPEFLGVFAILGVAVLGIAYWGVPDPSPGSGREPVTYQEYVGIQPAEIGTQLPCEPACFADRLLSAWIAEHPDVEILRQSPRFHDGVLIGYDVEYRLS